MAFADRPADVPAVIFVNMKAGFADYLTYDVGWSFERLCLPAPPRMSMRMSLAIRAKNKSSASFMEMALTERPPLNLHKGAEIGNEILLNL